MTMDDKILSELVAIKRLFIFTLMKNGASQGEVAKGLGVDQSRVSRMFAPREKPRQGRAKRR
jgi:predicted transcriptional regulator